MNYIIEDIALLYDLKSADFFLLRMDNYFYDENKNKICNKKLCNFTLSCICEYILNFQFFNQVTNPKTLIHLF